MNRIKISVVVPAYNCDQTIAQCIKSILNQSYPVDELIVVDDGSTDLTAQEIKVFETVRYFYQDNAGPAQARNFGQKQTTGEVIFFTDSDCAADRDWIQTAMGHFSKDNIGVVAGSYGIINEKSRLARCIHAEIRFRHLKLMPKTPKSFGSFNFGVKKDVFESVGGFNKAYRAASGEDNDLSYKIQKSGSLIYFEPNSLVRHKHPSSIIRYLKEQFRHGFWRVKMYLNHPQMVLGDDYTFWKDMLEVPMILLVLVSGFLGAIGVGAALVTSLILMGILYMFELIFCLATLKRIPDSIYFSLVLFFRAFARTLGFSSGIVWFFPIWILKKGNKSCNSNGL